MITLSLLLGTLSLAPPPNAPALTSPEALRNAGLEPGYNLDYIA